MISTVLDVATFVVSVLLIAFCIVYRKRTERRIDSLSSELDREKNRRETAEKTIETMQRRANGCREPDSMCIGCKYLITHQVIGSGFFPEIKYGCKKNIRCPEYEEDKTCSSKE